MTASVARWGALFDWDGVIVDSSPQHREAWERLAREEKRELPPDHFVRGFGLKNETIVPEILQWTSNPGEVERLSLRKEALYRDVLREIKVEALPGVRNWLETLREHGIPCAVGSSTHRPNIDLALGQIGLADFFQAIVTAEDVTRGKPDPEVFVKGAERLGLPPERCVVFEDAFAGLQAGRDGGMKTIGVATTHPREELHMADLAVERLDQLDYQQIAAWFPVTT